ncbi:enoyl-CoA hydratase [Nocardia macrotermitis]|uniref:Putative enoyl-CoA hydratase EchA13 n=1 Tax=Nocardia macrotermitis TaxID=2585198 RepID=A0A7K0DE81_9NOCA|nr:enoyl-CoA hydratase [Nocardia macrotermitis]MQY24110.1 putative enoyl-CoA hydratase EchA13 [Nocardia macrotermitis]
MSTELVLYDAADGIATISLNRPEVHNAQNMELLDQLDAAWSRAELDPQVRVIVLRANGKHFSAGHDIDRRTWDNQDRWLVSEVYEREAHRYVGYSLRWRNIPKPSIAAVQGVCIAGGLLLAWPCDLIVAADNARFSDPVVAMGIGGVEYHGHTWELGHRLAKEILFTGRAIDAQEALRAGMINKVVTRDELDSATRELAAQIAEKHPFALRAAKRAVNQTLDIQGFTAAVQAVFDIHQLGHAHAISETGQPVLMALTEMKGRAAQQKQ